MEFCRRHILLIGLGALWLGLFVWPFWKLVGLSLGSEAHTHILMIPFVCLYIGWLNRKKIFADISRSPKAGAVIIGVSLVIYLMGYILSGNLVLNDYLFFTTLAGVVYVIGAFIWVAGLKAFRSAAFCLLFLLFMVPIPVFILDGIIRLLQAGTADAAEVVFRMLGIPAFRDGQVFSLSNVTVEVASQCSGIRSTLVLVIIGVLVAYMYLDSFWRRVVLIGAIIPISIFKNALRVVLLAYLGNYVDISWLVNSGLHRNAGIPFMFIALLLLLPVLFLLRRGERRERGL